MENLLYVLLGILWVAYSLYSAKQKASQKQKHSTIPPKGPSHSSPLPLPEGEGRSILEELFRGLSGETSQASREIKPVILENKPFSQNEIESNQPFPGYSGYKFVTNSNTDSSIKVQANAFEEHANEEDITKKKEFKEKFDLRQAVIFSELLNRKYF
jgi:hypothetical protein